jgi:UDP-N-acetylglucosamine 1-carboxyvinyltransferase
VTDKYIIQGQRPLNGQVTISGAKNSVLKLMSATLLTESGCKLYNVPNLTDVTVMANVLQALGRKVVQGEGTLEVLPGTISTCEAPYQLVSKMRASFNVLGSLLGRYGEARVPLPGGCTIGKRGIDQHIKGLELLGAELTMSHGTISAKSTGLKGANIALDMPSMGATENIILSAVLAEGTTVLANAAQEPEIQDLILFLNAMGANIEGAGTSQVTIHGVKKSDLHGVEFTVMPDRIEAATFMAAVTGTTGNIIIEKMQPNHLATVMGKLEKIGTQFQKLDATTYQVSRLPENRLQATSYVTTYYPGFPTDLQAPLMPLLAVAEGVSMVTENIYENRFKHVGELNRMGANIQVQNEIAVITGVSQLSGAEVKAHDLRAGAAMVIASLMAEGHSSVYNLNHLDRGYDSFHLKLQNLGANINRLPLTSIEHQELLEVL